MTAEEIDRSLANGGDQSDWTRVRTMTQEEVERLADEDEGPLPEGWEKTVFLGLPDFLAKPEPKQDVHIRLDPMVLRWFKAQGPGYQTRINAVLRAFVRSQQGPSRQGRDAAE